MIKFGNYKREFGFLGRIAVITVILVSSIMFGSCENTWTLTNMCTIRPHWTPFSFPAPERKSISMERLLFFPMNQYL